MVAEQVKPAPAHMILLERRKLKEEKMRRSAGQSEVDVISPSDDVVVTNVTPVTSPVPISEC
jgi:hypothetical protein